MPSSIAYFVMCVFCIILFNICMYMYNTHTTGALSMCYGETCFHSASSRAARTSNERSGNAPCKEWGTKSGDSTGDDGETKTIQRIYKILMIQAAKYPKRACGLIHIVICELDVRVYLPVCVCFALNQHRNISMIEYFIIEHYSIRAD